MATYNVRLIKYKGGDQLRVYSHPLPYQSSLHKKGVSEDSFLSAGSSDRFLDGLDNPLTGALDASVSRSKSVIYRLSRANDWEWFVTLTFDPKVVDSKDYDTVVKKLTNWLRNIRQRYAPDMLYLFVPEFHRDKQKLHFHGLISCVGDLPLLDSGLVALGKKLYPANEMPLGTPVYNLPKWRYGFTTVTRIRDSQRASGYICKYITKDLCRISGGRHRYFSSINLDRPKEYAGSVEFNDVKNLVFKNLDKFNYVKSVQCDAASLKVRYIELGGKNKKEKEWFDA